VTKGSEIDSFGCHKDIDNGRFVIICHNCLGDGCDTCKQSGIVYMNCCPSRARMNAIRDTGNFFRAYRWLEEKSIFPITGALFDQSAFFIHCVEFVNVYRSIHQRKKEENKEKFASITGRKA
jgi:hypothetical protein